MKKLISFTSLLFLATLFVTACGQDADTNKNSEISLAEIVDEVRTTMGEILEENGVENPIEDGQLMGYVEVDLVNPAEDNAFFIEHLNINPDDLEEGYMIVAMMNINSDQIILLKAKDENKVAALKEALEDELTAQDTTWKEYLPDQYEKVKNNIIKTNGKYLLYVTYEQPEKIESIFDSKTK